MKYKWELHKPLNLFVAKSCSPKKWMCWLPATRSGNQPAKHIELKQCVCFIGFCCHDLGSSGYGWLIYYMHWWCLCVKGSPKRLKTHMCTYVFVWMCKHLDQLYPKNMTCISCTDQYITPQKHRTYQSTTIEYTCDTHSDFEFPGWLAVFISQLLAFNFILAFYPIFSFSNHWQAEMWSENSTRLPALFNHPDTRSQAIGFSIKLRWSRL